MSVRYGCCDERRRERLQAEAPGTSGIDYVEVHQGNPMSQPSRLDVFLVNPVELPRGQLTASNIRLTGGVRFPAPIIDPAVESIPAAGPVTAYRITIPGGQQTDFSTYRLTLVAGAGGDPPEFVDPRLASVEFSFKVDCGSELDCVEPPSPPEEEVDDDPAFDYRTRDWEGFRRLMLDRLAVLVPGFREDDPVDLTTQVIEALAYRWDQQSYQLDWISTEAFLDLARSRTSVVRHARLVDHRPAEGANARTFVAFDVQEKVELSAGTPVLPRQADLPVVVPASRYAAWLRSSTDLPVVFETLDDLTFEARRSQLELHAWGDDECCLPRGSTAATLVHDGTAPDALQVGGLLLLLELRSPTTGTAADADPARRHVVRLTSVTPVEDVLTPGVPLVDVAWSDADALPFDLVVTREVQEASGTSHLIACAVARGNVALVEHGASLPPITELALPPSDAATLTTHLDPPAPEAGRRWRPRLRAPGLPARVARHSQAEDTAMAAVDLVAVPGREQEAALRLRDPFGTEWHARPDLLATGPFGRDFVVESDGTGTPVLRFGDDVHGLAPTVGAAIGVVGRFGTGLPGNIGADALGHVVVPDASAALRVTSLTNPLPGRGGAEPDGSATAKAVAPEAFRVPQRAVTAEDYAWAALQHRDVANAMALTRWTGSWQTVVVHVDRVGGHPVDDAFRSELRDHLEGYRLAGFDVAVRAAQPVPLDIELAVCARPDEIRSQVGRRVHEALTPYRADGGQGFFHPDRFTFGTALYLSSLVAAAMAVPGVQSVTPLVFQRFARLSQGELSRGVIEPGQAEVLELRDDPSFPERGRLRITMRGGR